MELINEEQRLEELPYKLPSKITDILDYYKKAVHTRNTSVVMIVDGRSGMGKTTLANQMGLYCDPDFNLNKLHYEPETFLNGGKGKIGLKQAKKGDYILFDEAMLISNRAALSQINRMIIQAMSMIRSKNLVVVFCVNSIFDLDKNLALSRADILFHVYGSTLVDRGNVAAFFQGIDNINRLKTLYLLGKKYYDYGKPKSNFNTRFPRHFVLDEEVYERNKQIGVNNFLNSISNKSSNPNSRFMNQRDKAVMWIRNNSGLKIKEIAEIINVSTRTIDNIIAADKEKKEREGN